MVPSVMVEQGLLGSHVRAIALQERAPGFDNCLIHRSETPLTPPAAAFAAMFASCARVVMRGAAGSGRTTASESSPARSLRSSA